MKITFLLLNLSCFSICFSQTVKGKIVSDSLPVSDVEVINITQKEVVKASKNGNFEIKATAGNWISFYHKNYDVVKIYVDSLFDYSKNLEIVLIRKSEKIEEVLVKNNAPYFGKINLNGPVGPSNKPNVSFSDGTFNTPVDFMALGKMLLGLFKNNDKVAIKKQVPVEFRAFTAQSYSDDFLAKSLKLKPEEIETFLNFCSFDEKSKEAVANSDSMILLQYLITKSEEYKKVYQKE